MRNERFDLFPSAAERDEEVECGADKEKYKQINADDHDDSDVPKMRGGRGFLGKTVQHYSVREKRNQAEHQAADEYELFSGLDRFETENNCTDQNADQIQNQLTTGQSDQF